MLIGLKTGFEPGIFCSGGGRDDHYAPPPGHYIKFRLLTHITQYSSSSHTQKEEASLPTKDRRYEESTPKFEWY
jgi:hypothetical protein